MPEFKETEAATTMRQQNFATAEHALSKTRTRRKQFFVDIERELPWAGLIAAIKLLHATNGRAGRQPMDASKMVRVFLLQLWYGFFDEVLEDSMCGSQALRDFVSVNLSQENRLDQKLRRFKAVNFRDSLSEPTNLVASANI